MQSVQATSSQSNHVQIVEVGPRDGLQNDAALLSPDLRAELVRHLAASGVTEIEAVSFVHPQRVPQMAGAEEVIAQIGHLNTRLTALILNERGFERALASGLRRVRFAFPVTEGFARRNQNQSVNGATQLARTLIKRARHENMNIGIVLAASFGCPFDGRVSPAEVLKVAAQIAADAPDELVFADTIGVGNPASVREVLSGAAAFRIPSMRLGAHFHNTRNTGYANAVAAIEAGATALDSSLGGLGGCPFAPRATGNIATEDVGYLLREMGLSTGLDLEALIAVGHWLSDQLGHSLPGMLAQAGDFPG